MPSLSHKFSMTTHDARPGEYVLAITHFGQVVALIASRGASDPEGQARALIDARTSVPSNRDSYKIERVMVSNITIQPDEPRTYVAEVTARNEIEAREKFASNDIQVREQA